MTNNMEKKILPIKKVISFKKSIMHYYSLLFITCVYVYVTCCIINVKSLFVSFVCLLSPPTTTALCETKSCAIYHPL